jgi:hypothetical protein
MVVSRDIFVPIYNETNFTWTFKVGNTVFIDFSCIHDTVMFSIPIITHGYMC